MSTTEFIYYVNDLVPLVTTLSDPRVVCVCHSVTDQYITRADTGEEVSYMSSDINSKQMTLYTEDLDQQLRGLTIAFNWVLDLSDGSVGNVVASFNIEFIGINNLPFFDPPLTSYFQIYKQNQPFEWVYELPPYFDEDVRDTVSVSVDITDTEDFMFIDENLKMSIPDLSSPDVPPGEYTILVTLTDGVEPIQSDVTVIIYAAPVFETEESEETLDETVEENVEDESTEETSEDGDTSES